LRAKRAIDTSVAFFYPIEGPLGFASGNLWIGKVLKEAKHIKAKLRYLLRETW